MSIIHKTTVKPGKLELLADWMRHQPWYRGSAPQLDHLAGGFRLDDPDGAVGCEFLLVTDTSDGSPYFAALAYRGAPLEGADDRLITTAEHGVLGQRWVYDGAGDPVVLTQLLALMRGDVRAHAQNEHDALDDSISPTPTIGNSFAGAEFTRHGSDAAGRAVAVDAGANGRCTVRFHHDLSTAPRDADHPGVRTSWEANGEHVRGLVVSAHPA